MVTPTTSSSMDPNHSTPSSASTSSPTSYDNVIMTTIHHYTAQSSTKTTDESYDIDNDSFRSDSLSDVSDIDTSSQNVAIQTSEQLEKTYHSSLPSEVPTNMAITDVYEISSRVSSTSSASPVSINITSKPVTTSSPTVATSDLKTLSIRTHSSSTSVSNSTSPHITVPLSSTSPSMPSTMPLALATSPSLPSSSPSSSSLPSSSSSTLLTALLSLDEDYNGNEMVVDESVFLYSSDGDENENAVEFDESVLHSNLETNHVLSSSLIMQLSSSSSVSLHGNEFYLSSRINLAIAWTILITLSLTLME
ncbi:uncharacterized serine-rich protein C215.13-like isoform X1 [Strongylocentrotus purpuratus]|uniref:Uncharacterized protein n=1 Tax=Strongylocentrotus purpuratus TaxID=7668 RepID=A0A7M7N5L9_STRPU|nr:uncharacterized serine-rich protein C215.13-like isoform X1 [Strongylocentrotus purpuratus]